MSAAAAYQTTDKDAIIAAEFGGARELLKMDRPRRGQKSAKEKKKAKDAELVALLDEPVAPFEVPPGADRTQGRDARIWKVELQTISPGSSNSCLFNAVATAMGKFKEENKKMQPDRLWVQRMVHKGLRLLEPHPPEFTQEAEHRKEAFERIALGDPEAHDEEEQDEAEGAAAGGPAPPKKSALRLIKENYVRSARFQDCSLGGLYELFLFSWAFDGHIRFRVLREDLAAADVMTIGKDGWANDAHDLNRANEEDVHGTSLPPLPPLLLLRALWRFAAPPA
jgi:hypothetical protein